MALQLSLAKRVALALVCTSALVAAGTALLTRWLEPWVAALVSAALLLPVTLWFGHMATDQWTKVVKALRDGVGSFRDHDFSLSIAAPGNDELGELVSAYNSLGDLLRRERLDLHQRELLLDTVIQTTPLSLVLTNAAGRIIFSNMAARQLLFHGRKLEGLDLATVLESAPAALREAVSGDEDKLFTIPLGGEDEVFHLSQRRFLLNAQRHRLILLKQLTRELAAQEVAVWKKVIRVIAHELNNSLAPISSLAHSGLMLAHEPDPERLERVFNTIAGRAAHLATFIDGYARFAKLPKPRLAPVEWRQFFGRLEGTATFRLARPLPEGAALLDASQLEQVLINLLKNAAESGSPPDAITVTVSAAHDGRTPGWMIQVADRGSGFTEEVLRDALLPFYSTKPSGTGLGLTLCREIVEAHGGRLALANRDGGGAVLTIWLPAALPAASSSSAA
ncbi:MAG: ATP-binding protein [Steroidobacteraceae bacterium]|nr:ATP-binding protein [Steroidobacteraceae bacterium]